MNNTLKLEKRILALLLTAILTLTLFAGFRLPVQAEEGDPESTRLTFTVELNAEMEADTSESGRIPDPSKPVKSNRILYWDGVDSETIRPYTESEVPENYVPLPVSEASGLSNVVLDGNYVFEQKKYSDRLTEGEAFIPEGEDGWVYEQQTGESDFSSHLVGVGGLLYRQLISDEVYETQDSETLDTYVYKKTYSISVADPLSTSGEVAVITDYIGKKVSYKEVEFVLGVFPSLEDSLGGNKTKVNTVDIRIDGEYNQNPFYGNKKSQESITGLYSSVDTLQISYSAEENNSITVGETSGLVESIGVAPIRTMKKVYAEIKIGDLVYASKTINFVITAPRIDEFDIESSDDLNDKMFTSNSNPVVKYTFSGAGLSAEMIQLTKGNGSFSATLDNSTLTVNYSGLHDGDVNIGVPEMGTEALTHFIVDTEPPKAKFEVSGRADISFFTRSLSDSIFIKFSEPVEGESDLPASSGEESEAVEFILTVEDDNIDWSQGEDFKNNTIYTLDDSWDVLQPEGKIVFKKSVSVDKEKYREIPIDFIIMDMAGLVPVKVVEPTSGAVTYNGETGELKGKFAIDRKRPSTSDEGIPAIDLNSTTEPIATVDGSIPLYNSGVSFYGKARDEYSGLDGVIWEAGAEGSQEHLIYPNNGSLSITSETDAEGNFGFGFENPEGDEYNDVTIKLTATDNVGNKIWKTERLAIDTLKPRVSMSDLSEPTNSVDEEGIRVDYYQNDLDIDFIVEDLNLENTEVYFEIYDKKNDQLHKYFTSIDEVTQKADGDYEITFADEHGDTIAGNLKLETGDDDVRKATITFKATEGELKAYYVLAEDLAENTNEFSGPDPANRIVIDKTAPIIAVNKSESVHSEGVIDYHDKDVTFDVTVYDVNYDIEKFNMLTFTATDTAGEDAVITLTETAPFTYTGKITLGYEQSRGSLYQYIVSQIEGTIKDKALWGAQKGIFEENKGNFNENIRINDGAVSFKDNYQIIVDKVEPTVSINGAKAKDSVNHKDKTYYFADAGKASLSVNVTDINLNEANTYVTYNIIEKGKKKTAGKLKVKGENGIFSLDIPLVDGQMISDIYAYAEDYALNNKDDGRLGESYVVDATNPKVKLEVAGDGINSVFSNTKDQSVYVKFDQPAAAASGQKATGTKKVTFKVTVDDKNVVGVDQVGKAIQKDPGYANKYYVRAVKKNASDAGSWKATNATTNVDKTLTYEQTIKVPADTTEVIMFNLEVMDLAGNSPKLADDVTVIAPLEDPTEKEMLFKEASGKNKPAKIGESVVADRDRPSSNNDERDTPVIILTPLKKEVATLGGGKLLYNGSVNYKLDIYDPIYNDPKTGKKIYSGLKLITWEVTSDVDGLIATSSNEDSTIKNKDKKSYSQSRTQKDSFTIPVNITKTGETNNIKLTVRAYDYSGNVTTYNQYLAIDNQKPTVTVSYDNNSEQNGKYFKADRNLTVTITDLNFDATKTSILTQPGVAGPVSSGKTHKYYVSYNVDGDYTFYMSTVDKALNQAPIDYTNGGNNAAPNEFTIDKTVPVITVTFDNNNVRNGKYYNAARTATVNILEHNFNAADVKATITASLDGAPIEEPKRSGFTGGDSHNQQIPFMADGDYTITVNYTDLAGNPAVAVVIPEFTIDTTDPKAIIEYVDNMQAYANDIAPTVTFDDINFDGNGYTIVWNVFRRNATRWELLSTEGWGSTAPSPLGHGIQFKFFNLDYIPDNDGLYSLSATITDLAGNTFTTETVQYSVNRFGSIYKPDDATAELLDRGITNKAPKLSITEINATKVHDNKVTDSVNGTTKTLEEVKDYSLNKSEPEDRWKSYTYNTTQPVFENEDGTPAQGSYVITLYSTDEAGHMNSNRTNVDGNNCPVEFIIDTEAPSGFINVAGLAEGKTRIQAAETDVTTNWEDNNWISRVEIYYEDGNGKGETDIFDLDDPDKAKAKEAAEVINSGKFDLVAHQTTRNQTVRAVLIDAAGNERDIKEVTFFLNASGFQQFLHNTPAVVGASAGLAALIALIIILLALRRKKNNEAEG